MNDRLRVDEGCVKRKRDGDSEEDDQSGHTSRKRLASEMASSGPSPGMKSQLMEEILFCQFHHL